MSESIDFIAKQTPMKEIQGRFYEIIIDGLGEIKFLFKKDYNRYNLEIWWSPIGYDIANSLSSHNTDSSIKDIKKNLKYYIDMVKESCMCHIKEGNGDEEIFDDILTGFFNEKSNFEKIFI